VPARLILTNGAFLIAQGAYAEVVEHLEYGERWTQIDALQQDGQVRTTHVNPAHVLYAELWDEDERTHPVFVE
jgi:hypothetical protein